MVEERVHFQEPKKTISSTDEHRNIRPALLTLILVTFVLSAGCVHTPSRPHIPTPKSAGEFDALRNNDVVITSLIDIRDLKARPDDKKFTEMFSEDQRSRFAASVGYFLFSEESSISVRTSGPVFDNVMAISNLKQLARKANNKESFSPGEAQRVKNALGGFRFVVFFSFTKEEFNYEVKRELPTENSDFFKQYVYTARRDMEARVALWDSQSNQVLYTSVISPNVSITKSTLVKNNISPEQKKSAPESYKLAENPDKLDRATDIDLAAELKLHRSRFPEIPDREPRFFAALKEFKPKPQNQISVQPQDRHDSKTPIGSGEDPENFRAEISLKSTVMGVLPLPTLYLGGAKLKYNFFRIGGGIEFTPKSTLIDHELRIYDVYNGCICLTADLEWSLGNKTRILTGAYLGIGAFTYSQSDLMPNLEGTETRSDGDVYWYRAPRVRYMYGDKKGVQFGFGVYQHYYNQLERPELVANHPALWGIEFTLAAASGGN